ncbi:Sulfotransferase 4A1 [Varanus komodoensis]|nr:Sulfotransferase 4A1 [Varanus komodoensis]
MYPAIVSFSTNIKNKTGNGASSPHLNRKGAGPIKSGNLSVFPEGTAELCFANIQLISKLMNSFSMYEGKDAEEEMESTFSSWQILSAIGLVCTSLLQEVVYLVSQGADPDEIGLMNIDEQLPVLEYPQPGLDIIKELTSPRLIKSHLPYRFLPSDLHSGDSKVIYMARNPKDLVVSYYQFHRSLRTMSYRGTFQEFCRRFMNDKLGYGSWFEHVQEFWQHHMDSNVLFLKYEDMHKSKGLAGVFSSTTIQGLFDAQPSLWSNFHSHKLQLGKP